MSQPADESSARDEETDDAPRAPAWVRYLVIGLAVVVLVVLAAMLLLGGEHGPGRHG